MRLHGRHLENVCKKKRIEKRTSVHAFGSPAEEGEAETLIKDKRLCLSPFFCVPQQLLPPPPPFLIYCSGKHIPSLSVQCLQHGRLLYSPLSGHILILTRINTTHTFASVSSGFSGTNTDEDAKSRVNTKQNTQILHRQDPCWATAGGVGLKDDVIPSPVSANVFVFQREIKKKVVVCVWEGGGVDRERGREG